MVGRSRAWVRFLRDNETGSPYDFEPALYRRGEQRELIQSGRAGEPVDRSRWHTSSDVDHMHFVPADVVEVVEVLTEDTPSAAAGVKMPANLIETPGGPFVSGIMACRAECRKAPGA